MKFRQASERAEFLENLSNLCKNYMLSSDDFVALSICIQTQEEDPSRPDYDGHWDPETCEWENLGRG